MIEALCHESNESGLRTTTAAGDANIDIVLIGIKQLI